MIYNLYTIFDKVAGAYTDIQVFPNDEVAKRNFKISMQNCKYANDCQLYKLGSYDVLSGKIDPCLEFLEGGVKVEE